MKLNMGCGPHTPNGWVNVDYWIGARLQKTPILGWIFAPFFKIKWDKKIILQDLTKRWQWPDGSANNVYSSHLVEHMWKEDGEHFMAESFRTLKRGGVIRIVVPDLKSFVERYLEGEIESTDFLNELWVFSYKKSEGWHIKLLAPYLRFPHKCMYDLESMKILIEAAGFKITHTSANSSDIPDIKTIELPNRVKNSIVVEAVKPVN